MITLLIDRANDIAGAEVLLGNTDSALVRLPHSVEDPTEAVTDTIRRLINSVVPSGSFHELKVEGIIEMPTGILAFVLGRDNVSYIIRPGTKLYNGEVSEIHPKKVVFKQYVNDPGRLKPYDEIVRELTD
jgi:hypothetical protein